MCGTRLTTVRFYRFLKPPSAAINISDVWAEEHDHGHTENTDHETGAGEHDDHDDRKKRRHRLRKRGLTQQSATNTARSITEPTPTTTNQQGNRKHQPRKLANSTSALYLPPAPTIPDLFDRIQEGIHLMSDPTTQALTGLFVSHISLHFNETYGYPEQIVISYHHREDAAAAATTKATIVALADNVYFAVLSHLQPLLEELHHEYRATSTNYNVSTTTTNTSSNNNDGLGIQQQLDQAMALWNAYGMDTYTFQYNVASEGLLSDKQHLDPSTNRKDMPYPWNVTIHEGQVETVADSQNQTFYQANDEEEDHGDEGAHDDEENHDEQHDDGAGDNQDIEDEHNDVDDGHG